MATGVGLHIAEHICTAAIVCDEHEPQYILREPILHMSDNGDAVLGGTPPPGPTHTITGFVSAVGDPAGVSVDEGEAFRGEDLLATAMFCLIDLTAEHLHGPAEFWAVHPSEWPIAQILALRGALDYLGLKSVTLVDENDLPPGRDDQPGTGAHAVDAGKPFAEGAARAALAAVLDTPAGATPPDPAAAQNSALDTVVIPKLGDGSTPAKAYSAVTGPNAAASADPESTYGGPSLAVLAAGLGPAGANHGMPAATPAPATPTTAATSAQPAGTGATPAATDGTTDKQPRRRITALVAVAAVLGAVIGAIGVTLVLQPGAAQTPPPTTPPMSRTSPPAAPQPVAPPPPPEPTYVPEPTYSPEPTVAPEPPAATTPTLPSTGTTPTETSIPPSSSGETEPTGPTLTEPTTETETPTTSPEPSKGFDFLPFPMPFQTEDPDVELPDTGSKEGRQREAR